MNLNDLAKEFEAFSVCFCHDDYSYSAYKLLPEIMSGLQAFEVEVQTAGNYYVSMHIPDTKFEDVPDYFYHSFVLFRKNEKSELEYIGGKQDKLRDTFFEAKLKPGKYILVVRRNYRL